MTLSGIIWSFVKLTPDMVHGLCKIFMPLIRVVHGNMALHNRLSKISTKSEKGTRVQEL